MFLSGGQIDVHGNTNVTAIGGMPNPKIKLGGGGGGCNLSATIKRLTVWSTNHRSGRCLVDRCDFITDLGHRTPAGSRHEFGYTGGGPEWLVTELGVFDYPEGRARLVRHYPDVSVEEIVAGTGFAFEVASDVAPMDPPVDAEIAAVRSIDPLGVRRSEFRPAELDRRFE